MTYLLHLSQPLRQGQTLHYFLAMQFDIDSETRVKLNLTPEQIKEKYGDNLESEVYGPLSDVLSNLLKHVAGV